MDFKPISAESTQTLFNALNKPVVVGTPVSSGLIDVRGFSSYYLNLDGDVTVASTVFNSILVRLTWVPQLIDPSGNNDIFRILYQDVYEYWLFQDSGTALFPGGDLMVQDTMHGPYMNIDILNLGGDSKTMDYHLLGTTRQLPGTFARQPTGYVIGPNSFGAPNDEGPDMYMVNKNAVAIANTATATVPALFAYGRAKERITTGAGGLTITVQSGFERRLVDTLVIPANTTVSTERVLPKRSLIYSVSNTSGIASTYTITLIAQLERS